MIIENSIGWTDVTGNKMIGCSKVSPGCAGCYAENDTPARVLRHRGIETWGVKGQRVPIEGFAKKVRRLNKLCVCDKCHEATKWIEWIGKRCVSTIDCDGTYRRIRIFADSNSDWLDDRWPIAALAGLLQDIHDCPNLDFQLLTKRIENFGKRLSEVEYLCGLGGPVSEDVKNMIEHWHDGNAPANVWLGTSIENQKCADERIPLLLQVPAKVRFLSVEPLLGPVNLRFRNRSFGFPVYFFGMLTTRHEHTFWLCLTPIVLPPHKQPRETQAQPWPTHKIPPRLC